MIKKTRLILNTHAEVVLVLINSLTTRVLEYNFKACVRYFSFFHQITALKNYGKRFSSKKLSFSYCEPLIEKMIQDKS